MSSPIYGCDSLEAIASAMHKATYHACINATDEQYVIGLTWYETRSAMLFDWADYYSHTHAIACGVMAVTSPQLSYGKNVTATFNILTDRAPMHGIAKNHSKAYRIMLGDFRAISGPKVTAFFHNLLNPSDPNWVTIDSWMAKLGGLTETELKRKGAYDALAEGIRRAAKDLGILPNQAQAIAWVATRKSAY